MSTSSVLSDRFFGGLAAPFPAADAVALSAALVPPRPRAASAARARHRPRSAWLEVSPGTIALRSGLFPGWEGFTARGGDPLPDPGPSHGCEDSVGVLAAIDVDEDCDLAAAGLPPAAGRGAVSVWSARSRSRLARHLASLDWAGVLFHPETQLALVTLTYPGDWRAVVPDGPTMRRHLRAFAAACRRAFARFLPTVGGVRTWLGVWKREFQRRGAPHFHIAMPVPVGLVFRRTPGGAPGSGEYVTARQFVASAWARIVGSQGDELERHLVAGTAVDFSEGSRYSDPKRLAVYFLKHSAPTVGGSKEYQHVLPPGFAEPGRWWGVWGLRKVTATVEISEACLVEARRILRGWASRRSGVERRSSGEATWWVPYCRPVTRRVRVERVNAKTGEVRYRWVTRRRRLLDGGFVKVDGLRAVPGGWVLANDAPALLSQLSRFLTLLPVSGPAVVRPLPLSGFSPPCK